MLILNLLYEIVQGREMVQSGMISNLPYRALCCYMLVLLRSKG